jgi:hypothetical protein
LQGAMVPMKQRTATTKHRVNKNESNSVGLR